MLACAREAIDTELNETYLIGKAREHARRRLRRWPKARGNGLPLLLLFKPLLLCHHRSGNVVPSARLLYMLLLLLSGPSLSPPSVADCRDTVLAIRRRGTRATGTPVSIGAWRDLPVGCHGVGVEHPGAGIDGTNGLLTGNGEVATSWVGVPTLGYH